MFKGRGFSLVAVLVIVFTASAVIGLSLWAIRSQASVSNEEAFTEPGFQQTSDDAGTSMTAATPAPSADEVVSSVPDTAVSTSNTSPSSEGQLMTKIVTVTFDGSSYSRDSISINVGDTIKFVNESNSDMWPASDNHPTHTLYPEFDPQQPISPGESWSFIFSEAGSYPWHDHRDPSLIGVISVQ